MGLTLKGIVSDIITIGEKTGHTAEQIIVGTGEIFEGGGKAAQAGGDIAQDLSEYFPLILLSK